MIDSLFVETPEPVASASLFETPSSAHGAYDEVFMAPGTLREHWQKLVVALNATGAGVLKKRQERVTRMRHEDGATFNPFDDPSGRGTPWALEMIPFPITAGQWAILEAGVVQRAELLERILTDVYGSQNLVKNGQLAPELVFANPHFLRACHGIEPAGGRFLTYYAADLYRAPDGSFKVLRDYGANPAGLGYALENRIVISRVFSELYHQTQIQRLAPFFQVFHQSLTQRASRRQNPGIVLLSPGPDSRIYFEHALLSRYLGYPLVEGQDLTVRNGKVFLKKLAGLEPVEVIFRHIADDSSDPFALRRETATGVAGLIQVSREQNIDIVNPIGSGFVDTPVLPVFLPALCQSLLGQDLMLENHPSWWCGEAEGLDQVGANLGRLSLHPAMDRAPAVLSPDPMAAILASPYAFMGREPVFPSSVPAWLDSGVRTRYTLFRLFACATDQGFAVMPGGLAITAGDVVTLMDSLPERQQSKDIWVLSDEPVVPFSLMSGLETIPDFLRGGDLPSRVADHLLWLGRYLERAEGLVRLLRSIFRRLSGEARPADIPELAFLLDLLRAENTIFQAPEGAIGLYRELSAQLSAVLYLKDRPESVVAILKRVQEAARNVRDRLSLDSWRVINRLDGFADTLASDPLELLDDTLVTLSAFSGLAMESMTRSLGWRFLDMGRRVERAMNQAGRIRIGLCRDGGESKSALEALLEVSDSIITYRARYRTAFQWAPALDLLLVDESNPKSLAFQLDRLSGHVEHLPRPSGPRVAGAEERMALEMLSAVRLLDLTGLGNPSEGKPFESLTTFLEFTQTRLKTFSQQIGAHYLSRVPATPHFSMAPGDRRP